MAFPDCSSPARPGGWSSSMSLSYAAVSRAWAPSLGSPGLSVPSVPGDASVLSHHSRNSPSVGVDGGLLTWGFCGAVYQHEGSAWHQLHPQKEVFPTRGSRSPFRHPGYTKPKPKWDVHMEGGQAEVSVSPSGTFGRASLWRLSQSSSPHKCRSHLGFDLGCRQTSCRRSGRSGASRSGRPA